jgi:hypothetical protein
MGKATVMRRLPYNALAMYVRADDPSTIHAMDTTIDPTLYDKLLPGQGLQLFNAFQWVLASPERQREFLIPMVEAFRRANPPPPNT